MLILRVVPVTLTTQICSWLAIPWRIRLLSVRPLQAAGVTLCCRCASPRLDPSAHDHAPNREAQAGGGLTSVPSSLTDTPASTRICSMSAIWSACTSVEERWGRSAS